jgi:hypothetical protein
VTDYEALPDSMPPAELASHFDRLLSSDSGYTLTIAAALVELADRQWHTYQPLVPALHQRVDSWLLEHWNANSLEFLDAAMSIVAQLGLPGTWERIQLLATTSSHDSEIAKELHDFCVEMEAGEPMDPWSGMQRR